MPLALWLSETAQDPVVQEVVHDAASKIGSAGKKAAKQAASWIAEADEEDAAPAALCLGYWQVALLVFLLIAAILMVNLGVACICGRLGFFGGRQWERWRHPVGRAVQSSARELARLADFISTGGQLAIATAAAKLATTPEAVQAWWVQWQIAHRGPLRN